MEQILRDNGEQRRNLPQQPRRGGDTEASGLWRGEPYVAIPVECGGQMTLGVPEWRGDASCSGKHAAGDRFNHLA